MNRTTLSQSLPCDSEIWAHLQLAIAKSSGFQRWQKENVCQGKINIEDQVKQYLRSTLETLAY